MKSLINESNETICEFLLNNKKADALEFGIYKNIVNGKSDFTERVIYEDKSMKIIYSFLKIKKDDTIEQFFIYSTWWGKIKNSFFTLEGFKGKCEIRCGGINLNDLKTYNSDTNHVVNNHNQLAKIEVIDFASLTLYCQKTMKASPTYKVVEIISQSPNPWVKIKVIMPDGNVYPKEGTSKKDAANRFAVEYANEIVK
jgi:hypothetical protein